jgi:hypothetical protein
MEALTISSEQLCLATWHSGGQSRLLPSIELTSSAPGFEVLLGVLVEGVPVMSVSMHFHRLNG